MAVMVLLTVAVAAINLHDGVTHAIEGMTHFVLFASFLMLAAMGMSTLKADLVALRCADDARPPAYQNRQCR